ncbi:MAG: outer membrane protein assembly factor BamA [Oligoflexus sp.]
MKDWRFGKAWMRYLSLIGFFLLLAEFGYAQSKITEVTVRGNLRVEADAIRTMISSQEGQEFRETKVEEDIRSLHQLGYFSDIRVYQEPHAGGVRLIYEVKEKPAIVAISFTGMEEMKESDFEQKLETQVYTIVNENSINNDVRMIEKAYLEKGFYLAKATYKLEANPKNEHEVNLQFIVDEGGKVLVGDVFILGNKYFTDAQLINQFVSKPYTRSSFLSGPGSVYNDDFVRRDTEFLSYLYKDQGFAEVQVASPTRVMDQDRRFVRLTFEVEEGIQYSIGSIEVSGDVLYEKTEMLDWMQLKEGELFRFSRFRQDVELLIDKYGDLGYAFVDVNPKTRFDRENALVHIDYEITKGEKVYFGEFTFVGNTKTRDNVIRRELEVADGELYSGTRLTASKQNIERLGFFEEVQSIKSRDPENPSILHYRFRVKEKPTGQLQAAVGFSPNAEGGESSWFGQGRYSEENQSGKGWRTSFTGRWNGGNNYSLEIGFTDPRVNDSDWSLGFSAFWRNEVRRLTEDVQIQEGRRGGSVTIGRRLVELIRGAITFRLTQIFQDSDVFILDRFRQEGQANSVILSLSRNATNNYIDPSEGSVLRLSQEFTGGVLGGDRQYLESIIDGSYYLPLDFTETYRTYFHLHGRFGLLWPFGDATIPLFTRYTLGGPENLRGYQFREVGPKFTITQAPGDRPREINGGGNKELLFQLEYFFPLIQEANIKGLLFYDMGRVYNEDELVELSDFKRDVGFGFRWITPVAPFRFEWAYPLEDGQLGDLEFIFYLGY